MTSVTRCDPLTDPLLTPENSASIVIDCQPSRLAAVNSIDRELLGLWWPPHRLKRPVSCWRAHAETTSRRRV
jgi:hypothetical protein